MRWTTTAALAVLLAGLGTFYYVYDVRQAPQREKAEAEKDRVWKGLEAKDVDDVVLRRGSETVHLQKGGEGWTLVAPVQARAESRAVEDLLSTLTTARNEREIEASPAKPADYGLEPAAAEVTFKAKGQEHRLRLGAKNPTGIWVYAQLGGAPAVFLAPDSLLREAQKPVADFRDHTVLAFDSKEVKGLEIRPPTGPALVLQSRDDGWRLTAPIDAPADRQQVTGLLDKLRTAKIKEFMAETTPAGDPFGLARPLVVTLWTGQEKARAAKTLRLGKPVPEKKAVPAQREGEPTVFLVDEELVKAVPITATALRDKTVLAYERSKVERLELTSAKGRVALGLEGGAWRITAPTPLKADEAAASSLLFKLSDLKAKEFVAEKADRLAAYGLDRPAVRLSIWEKGAKEARTLLLTPARGKDGSAYATVVTGGEEGGRPVGPVALIDARAVGDLSLSVQDLRDKSLFDAFETTDVMRVTIQHGGVTLTVERKGDDWNLTGPNSGKARGPRIEDLLWNLRGLKWREIVAEQGWEPSRYGLDPPVTTVALTGKEGKTLVSLAIGRREGVDQFVRVPGRGALYALDPKSLGDVPTSPEDLRL